MKILYIDELEIEAQLIDSRAFVYFKDGGSDIIYIDDIENKDDAQELIVREIEMINPSNFKSASLIG